jgi:hypothetical protein
MQHLSYPSDLTGFQRDRSLEVEIRFCLNRTFFFLQNCKGPNAVGFFNRAYIFFELDSPNLVCHCKNVKNMKPSSQGVFRELLEQACLVKDPQKLQELTIEVSRLIAEWDAEECRALISELTDELAARGRRSGSG